MFLSIAVPEVSLHAFVYKWNKSSSAFHRVSFNNIFQIEKY